LQEFLHTRRRAGKEGCLFTIFKSEKVAKQAFAVLFSAEEKENLNV
jgi:hypothetical protein